MEQDLQLELRPAAVVERLGEVGLVAELGSLARFADLFAEKLDEHVLVATDDHYRRKDPVTVRVAEYTLDDPARLGHDAPYRLITTILDHRKAPVRELAALYCQRWEIETALDELKTHQRSSGQVLRSCSPDGIEQEVWAHLLVHHAIRSLMHTAATDAGLDPDRLSFLRTLRLVNLRRA